ncbi:hypothetical protein EC973_004347 [Apophysomyces ossiformis]|uniref:BZIP domain-containing protein n=1 Tax=Apophysomyces ossiformis TaxID=679940 RepID=A0A8H7EMI3_9FUNG|nr:hypothetical protein EC973_004347 [Apophysomyces ossiformis]
MTTTNYANANVPLSSSFTQPIILSSGNEHKRKRDEPSSDTDDQSLDENIAKSPRGNEDTATVSSEEENSSRKPGRKQMPEEILDDDEDPKIKRKAQNRAAQRAFRERKERYVKELENRIKCVQDNHLVATAQFFRENQHLRSIIYRLEQENMALKGIPVSNQEWAAVPPTTSPIPYSLAMKPIHHHPILLPSVELRPASCSPSLGKASTATPVPILPLQETHSADQRFKFAISTPASLRIQTNRPNPKPTSLSVEPVKLYPDHSHPATQTRRIQQQQQQQEQQQQQQEQNISSVTENSTQKQDPPTQSSLSPTSSQSSTLESYTLDELVFRGQLDNSNNKEINNGDNDILQDFLMDSLLDTPKLNPLSPSDAEKEVANDAHKDQQQVDNSIEQLPKVWHHITQLEKITQSSVDQLLQLVKKNAKCANMNYDINEWDFNTIIQQFDQGHL